MRGASIFYFARGLHRRDFFSTRYLIGAAWMQFYFRFSGKEDPDHVADARGRRLEIIEGHSVAEIQEIGEEIFDEAMAARIWPGTRALAQLHLDQGQRVWLVTAAPIEVAAIIARRLGLTGALGTVAEQENGVYTGRLVGDLLHGPAKADGRHGPRRAGGARSGPLLGLLRLHQRPADADAGRRPVRDQSRLQAACPRSGSGLADPRLPHRPQGRQVWNRGQPALGAAGGAVAAGLAHRRKVAEHADSGQLESGIDDFTYL